jgi:hypothetical protein
MEAVAAATSGVEFMDPREWRAKYRSALLKINSPAIEKEISDAEDAIVARTRELYQQTGPDVEVERDALDDAMYALHALKSALKRKSS